tara:strand:+ start:420 stop:617 length:198 start_codon:yes stop_codon:yes gene_type:complete
MDSTIGGRMKVGDLVKLKARHEHSYSLTGEIGVIVKLPYLENYRVILWAGQERTFMYPVNELEAA